MTHIKLPAGYEDWVEVPHPISSLPQRPEHGRFLEVIWGIGDATRTGTSVVWKPGNTRYFVPPKPVLPDVKPGAVVRYVDKQGHSCRAVKLEDMCISPWRVFTLRNFGADSVDLNNNEMLADVNADGFTVELEGL